MRSRIMARLAPLMAMSALSSPAFALVQAQPGVRAASPTVRLNVPAQPMKTALAEFALQSKQQLLYEPVIVEGKVSTAVVGNVAPADGLRRLLHGSGLDFRTSQRGAFLISPMTEDAPPRIIATNHMVQSAPQLADAGEGAPPPAAQRDPGSDEVIVVTGSSLRGVPAVGSNLITVGAEAIQDNAVQTVQEILQTVPQIWGSNASSQGAFGSFDASGLQVPQIHGLGGANSSSTLVVIDGHRFPTMGVRRNLADPNFIPPNAIQRVEVLAEGASSIYGSDAVAGVLNFITRRRFEGVEGNVQYGWGKDYARWSATLSAGTRWDDGGAAVYYSYSDRGDLLGADRPLTLPDQRAQGGRNFGTFNCGPTSFQPAGSTLIYLYPYSGAGIANAQQNAPCEQASATGLMPAEKRHSLMVKLDQKVGDRVSLTGDVVYSFRRNTQRQSVGVITSTVFGPGSGRGGQINPFFVAPANASAATSGTARFAGDELFPDGARVLSEIEVFYGHANAEYELSDAWRLSGMIMAGSSVSSETRIGELCGACVNQALNGTTNGNGTMGSATLDPLTANNALDIWSPRATNRTSAAVLARIRDSRSYQRARQEVQQFSAKIDGSLFALPAGDVRTAVGLDMVRYKVPSEVVESNGSGPVSLGSSYNAYLYERTVKSAFGELLLPIVSEGMAIPGIQSFELNLSGRYDHYDEWGSLFNPKYAFNWVIADGVKIRGNYAESFVAPQFSTYGPDKLSGMDGRSVDSFFGPQTQIIIPLSKYPEARAIPGCDAPGQVSCSLGSAGIAGARLQGANPDVQPSTGKAWAIGADFTPTFLPGFSASLTYWHNTLKDAPGGPQPAIIVNSTRFHDLLTIYPTGATPEQLEAFRRGIRQNAPLAAGPIYFTYDSRNRNLYTIYVDGIDFDVRYRHQFGWGTARVGVSGTHRTRFDQRFGDGEPIFSVLNRNKFNSTFPTIQTEARADLGIEAGPVKATVFANYIGGYTFWGTSATNPVTSDAVGLPSGGGDKVKSYTTVKLNLQYDLKDVLPVDATLTLNVDNLFDAYPPFVNVASGYDDFTGFVLGRVITVGLRAKF